MCVTYVIVDALLAVLFAMFLVFPFDFPCNDIFLLIYLFPFPFFIYYLCHWGLICCQFGTLCIPTRHTQASCILVGGRICDPGDGVCDWLGSPMIPDCPFPPLGSLLQCISGPPMHDAILQYDGWAPCIDGLRDPSMTTTAHVLDWCTRCHPSMHCVGAGSDSHCAGAMMGCTRTPVPPQIVHVLASSAILKAVSLNRLDAAACVTGTDTSPNIQLLGKTSTLTSPSLLNCNCQEP